MTSQDEGKDGEPSRKKKTRKRTAKERSKSKNKLMKNEAPRGALWGLQVLSKSEWKALRNKYLNLQRKYMKEMKMNIHNKKHQYSSIPALAAPSVEAEGQAIIHDAQYNKPSCFGGFPQPFSSNSSNAHVFGSSKWVILFICQTSVLITRVIDTYHCAVLKTLFASDN